MSKAGERVGAILSGNAERVKFLGWGVYEGDKLRPNWQVEARAYLPIQRKVLRGEAAKTAADWLDWHSRMNEWYIEKKPDAALTDQQLREAAQASYERAQARLDWTDEQVVEDMKGTSLLTNPCIRLDSGKVVWGMECWWGDAERVQRQLDAWEAAGAEIVTVDIDAERA